MRNLLLAAAFVVSWSSGFVGATLGDRAAPPAALLAWRYLTAFVLLLGVMASHGRGRRELAGLSRRDMAQQATLGVLSHVVFLGGVFAAAAAGLDAGVSALICAMQPMIVAAAGCVWFSDRLTATQVAGLVVGLVGVTLSVGAVGAGGLGAVWLVGASLLALCAAAMLERAWQPQVSVTSSLIIQMGVAATMFTGWAACTTGLRMHVGPDLFAAIAWLVLLSGFGGYATFTACLRRLGATPTSMLLYLTPAVTMLWAWAMFDQVPSPMQIAGLVVVFIGVAAGLERQRAGAHADGTT